MPDPAPDAAALARTHAEAFAGSGRAWSEAEFAALLARPGAVLTGDARAFVLGCVTLDEAEVLTLATAPAHRRRGLARATLAAFLDHVAKAGATRVFLEVDADNAAARALYGQAGFSLCGTRRGYCRHPDGRRSDALVLERRLTPAE